MKKLPNATIIMSTKNLYCLGISNTNTNTICDIRYKGISFVYKGWHTYAAHSFKYYLKINFN